MSRKEELYFPSKDGNTEIHTIIWRPQGPPRAVLQICHGMLEYIERYEEFAGYLTDRGFLVVGNDHLGHGKSVQSRTEYGYMHKTYGNVCLLSDMHTLRQKVQGKYPDIPYFLFGHSMGSILTRQYMALYGKALSGVILSGAVAPQNRLLVMAGKLACRLNALVFGWHHRSRLLHEMALGGYNRRFRPSLTGVDWISSDAAVVERYARDPLCTFRFTTNGFYTLFDGVQHVQRKEALFIIPKHLPILILSGEHDPVGDFGRGVRKIYSVYRRAGIRDVMMKLYPQKRHEIVNEIGKDEVYEDIGRWLESHMRQQETEERV